MLRFECELHPAVPPVQAAHEELLHRYQELKAKKMEGLQDVLAAQAAQVLTSAVCHSALASQLPSCAHERRGLAI